MCGGEALCIWHSLLENKLTIHVIFKEITLKN